MPSPFPGMDPYLEMPPFWSDFAPSFLAAIRNALLADLLPRYDVRIEEYLLLMKEEEYIHRVKPDLTVASTSTWQPGFSGGIAVADPMLAELEYPELEPLTQRHLEIIHQADQTVVTVLELLSSANKQAGESGIDAYLNKRSELIASRVNLVELDLLRGGERLPMRGTHPAGDYFVYIGRMNQKPRCQVMGWRLSLSLPTISIPLLPPDDDARLDLSRVFRSAYDAAFYDQRLPYRQPLRPVPDDTTLAWIRDRLLAANKL